MKFPGWNKNDENDRHGVDFSAVSAVAVDTSRVLGLDVSHWDGVVDFEKAKRAGVKFVFVKAKNGLNTAQFFKENWEGAKRAGLLRGAYHWLYRSARVSAGAQARELWKLLQNDPGELPPVVDYEWTKWNGTPDNPDSSDLWGFVIPCESAFGRKPIIYTAPGYISQYPLSAAFKDYPLWIANYGVTTPVVPKPFTSWKFWQFTTTLPSEIYGDDPRIKKGMDGNYWCGTEKELYAFAGVTPPADDDPPVIPPYEKSLVATLVTTTKVWSDGTYETNTVKE